MYVHSSLKVDRLFNVEVVGGVHVLYICKYIVAGKAILKRINVVLLGAAFVLK